MTGKGLIKMNEGPLNHHLIKVDLSEAALSLLLSVIMNKLLKEKCKNTEIGRL